MVAPMRMCSRALRLLHQTQKLLTETPPVFSSVQIQQVRFKKGAGRVKPPVEAKEKSGFVPKNKRSGTKKTPAIPITEEFLSRIPEDNVWFHHYYPKPKYTLDKALQCHREFACPEMLDNMQGLVFVDASLDFRTKKQTKFLHPFSKTIVFPHHFEDGTENRVIAFSKSEEDVQMAMDMGAAFAGGIQLIKDVAKGEVTLEDFDHLVCTVDILQDMVTIRKHLREHFPSKKNENLSGDMEDMMTRFTKGKTFETTSTDNVAVGRLYFPIGQLEMSTEEIVDNYNFLLEEVSKQQVAKLGPFFMNAVIHCPPSMEKLTLEKNWCLPVEQRQSVEEEATDMDMDTDREEIAVSK